MRKKIAAVLAVLFLVMTAGCASGGEELGTESAQESMADSGNQESSADSDQGTIHTDVGKTFQITVPKGWQLDSEQSSDERSVYISSTGKASLEIRKQEADPNLLAYSASDFESSYSSRFTAFNLKKKEKTKIGSYTCIFLQYTLVQGEQEYTVMQYIMAGDADYSLTYSTTSPTKTFRTKVRKSIETFREMDPLVSPKKLYGRMNGRTYRDEDGAFQITLPEKWRFSEKNGSSVSFRNSDSTASIMICYYEPDNRLFQYKKSYFTKYFQNQFGEATRLSIFRTETLPEGKAIYLECYYGYYGLPLYAKQYLLNTEKNLVTLTATTTQGNRGKVSLASVARTLQIND